MLYELAAQVESMLTSLIAESAADLYAAAVRAVLREYHRRVLPMPNTAQTITASSDNGSGSSNLLEDILSAHHSLSEGVPFDWNLFGDPSYDPGFLWQTATEDGQALTGSLQPVSLAFGMRYLYETSVQEPFQGWDLPIPNSTS